MIVPCIFGLEWELALGSQPQEPPLERGPAFALLREELCQLSPWLPDRGNSQGIFSPGFRFYLDVGCHPEISSVEVASPRQLLDLKRGIFTLLGQALRRAQRRLPGLVLLVNNHDYVDSEAYWGCHESYAIRCRPDVLAQGMLPFLASRCLLAGSGRIDPAGRVLASPRAEAIKLSTGGATTQNRALYSTCRDEPLMSKGPFSHRLHLICGDAVRSDFSEYLKLASTVLVLLWLQEQPDGADDLVQSCPLRLLHSANVLWTPPGNLHISRRALQLQSTYCQRVSRFLDRHPEAPDWGAEAVAHWEDTLRLLGTDPLALSDRLDPFIKLVLFDAALNQQGRHWSDIAGNRSLYQELALLDVSYHSVGEDSPFQRLERQGLLKHHLWPLQSSPASLSEVVAGLPTRAAVRGRLIAELSGQAGLRCDWSGVQRADPGQWIALEDPCRTEAPTWQALQGSRSPVRLVLEEVIRQYDRGCYEQAASLLGRLERDRADLGGEDLVLFLRYTASTRSRRGYLDGPAVLEEAGRGRPLTFVQITDIVCAYRFQGLAPPPQMEAWIRRGLEAQTQHPGQDSWSRAGFLDHAGCFHLRRDRLEEARTTFAEARQYSSREHPRLVARLLADTADACRMLQERHEALRLLEEAEALQTAHGIDGELADFTWTHRAKLEEDRRRAREWLERALAAQTRQENVGGEARTQLLLARRAGDKRLAERCKARVLELGTQRPALARCWLVARILQHWPAWTNGGDAEEKGNEDPFWNL